MFVAPLSGSLEGTAVSGDLTDEDFGALAAASFAALDEEEAPPDASTR